MRRSVLTILVMAAVWCFETGAVAVQPGLPNPISTLCSGAAEAGAKELPFFGAYLSADTAVGATIVCEMTKVGWRMKPGAIQLQVVSSSEIESIDIPVVRFSVRQLPAVEENPQYLVALESVGGSRIINRLIFKVDRSGQPRCLKPARNLACRAALDPNDFASGAHMFLAPMELKKLLELCEKRGCSAPRDIARWDDSKSLEVVFPVAEADQGESIFLMFHYALGYPVEQWESIETADGVNFSKAVLQFTESNREMDYSDAEMERFHAALIGAFRKEQQLVCGTGRETYDGDYECETDRASPR